MSGWTRREAVAVRQDLAKSALTRQLRPRVSGLLLRAHAEEVVERIPRSLVPESGRRLFALRAWCLAGDPGLRPAEQARRIKTVRGLIAAYRETSDVLHGRRISLAPDPSELRRWRDQVASACEIVREDGARCGFCDSAP